MFPPIPVAMISNLTDIVLNKLKPNSLDLHAGIAGIANQVVFHAGVLNHQRYSCFWKDGNIM